MIREELAYDSGGDADAMYFMNKIIRINSEYLHSRYGLQVDACSDHPRAGASPAGYAVTWSMVLLAVSLAACEGSEEPAQEARTASVAVDLPARGVGAVSGETRDWLAVTDPMAPEVWLAARAAAPGAAVDPASVEELKRLIARARQMFHESARMVANRTLQLQRMLAEIAVTESPQQILEGLVALGREGQRIGFSDLCQQYFNMRAAGLDRAAALRALATTAPVALPRIGDRP